jgi:hypothetical protein
MTARRCFLGGPCVDCCVGTLTIGEYYMVKDDVWEQAWAGRRKSWHALDGQEILCIGCLEKRIGRTLTKHDFGNAPINDPRFDPNKSARLLDRLTADCGIRGGEAPDDGIPAFLRRTP